MEERTKKIKNKNKEFMNDDLIFDIINVANKIHRNKKLGINNPNFDGKYDEKSQSVILKEFGKNNILDIFKRCSKLSNTKCDCNHVYTCNGYYIYCTECGLRQPDDQDILYPLTKDATQAFINYGIINNTININNTLTKYDVMKKYPISMDLFNNANNQELFVKVLEHHNYEDIVEYFKKNNTKYRYYKDNTIYNSHNELLSELQFYTLFKSFWSTELSKIITFFEEKCKEHPIIHNICYNKHIIFNMNVLKELLNKERNQIIPLLLDTYNTNELSYTNYTNKQFVQRLYYSNFEESIIKLNDIYNTYLEWKSTRISTDNKLKKTQLRDIIIDHLNTKHPCDMDHFHDKYPCKIKCLKFGKYRDSSIKGENRFDGWKYLVYC